MSFLNFDSAKSLGKKQNRKSALSQIDVTIVDQKQGPLGTLLGWRKAWLAIDSNDRAISFVKTKGGSIILLVVFMLSMVATMRISTPSLALVNMARRVTAYCQLQLCLRMERWCGPERAAQQKASLSGAIMAPI